MVTNMVAAFFRPGDTVVGNLERSRLQRSGTHASHTLARWEQLHVSTVITGHVVANESKRSTVCVSRVHRNLSAVTQGFL